MTRLYAFKSSALLLEALERRDLLSFVSAPAYPAGALPSALAAADFNGDGLSDLAVINKTKPGAVSILLNTGGAYSTPKSFPTGGTNPSSLALGDFTADGRIDILVTNSGSSNVSFLRGSGTGMFRRPISYATGLGTSAITAADFDGDGDLDAATANDYGTVSVLLNQGSGTFQISNNPPAGLAPEYIANADFNADGRPDLVVANTYFKSVTVLLNNGDGTFGVSKAFAIAGYASGLQVGDFNNDSISDIAVPNENSASVSTLLGNGDGTFAPVLVTPVDRSPRAIAMGDFNSDGNQDLMVSSFDYSYPGTMKEFFGQGDGTFHAGAKYLVGDRPEAALVTDVDGDGRSDVVTANQGDNTVSVIRALPEGGFAAITVFPTAQGPSDVVTEDFNGDGNVDMVIADGQSQNMYVYLGQGDGGFSSVVGYATGFGTTELRVADFNGDAVLDAVALCSTPQAIILFLGNGDGSFKNGTAFPVGAFPKSVTVGDFDGNGHRDLATANFNSDNVSVLLGNGNGTFKPQVQYAVTADPVAVIAEDVTGDGVLDLVTTHQANGTLFVLMGQGDGTFSAISTFTGGGGWVAVTGDFNRDGHLDIAKGGSGAALGVKLGKGDGTFHNTTSYSTEGPVRDVAIGDFNGDGHSDLVATDSDAGTVSVFLNSGSGTFLPKLVYAAGVTNAHGVTVGDFNEDGKHDLAVSGAPSTTTGVLLGNGNGTFSPAVTTGAGGWRISIGDFNGDGHQDLAVGSVINVMLGNGDGTFQAPIAAGGNTQGAVMVADLNGDGKQDLAATSNTTPGKFFIQLGNGDGTFVAGGIFTVANVPREFVISDFNGDGALDVAVASTDGPGPDANEIGVLLATGNGMFLPAVSYATSDSHGITAGDFDGDGDEDLVVTGHDTSVGTILYGQFANGIVAAGPSAVSTVAADFNADGRPDFAVANFQTAGTISIVLGAGNGVFDQPVTYAAGKNPAEVALADFNLDGILDLAVAGESGITAFIGNGDGAFQAGVSYPAESDDLAIADFTSDGFPDIVATKDFNVGGRFAILRNAADWPPLPIGESQRPSYPASQIASGPDWTGSNPLTNALEKEIPLVTSVAFSIDSSKAPHSNKETPKPDALGPNPLEDRTLATCHVTRLSDTGAGMGFRGDLRYCINKVNAEPGPDVIDFHVTGTINLNGVLPDLASDMDIQGPGKDLLTIRRNTADLYRIFTVAAGTVRIAGLTVQNGSEMVGGGIYNQAELVLDGVVVSFNFSKEQGGGIYNAGRLEIYHSSTDNNRVSASVAPSAFYIGGGGIYNLGDLLMEHGVVAANYAFAPAHIAGGGLHNAGGGTATIRFTTISDNDAESAPNGPSNYSHVFGGGVYNVGTLTLESTALIRNDATDLPIVDSNGLAYGGGLYSGCASTSTLIVNTTIAHNVASATFGNDYSYGGGIFAECPNVIVKNSTIANNFAAGSYAYGGGVLGDLYLYNTIVADNSLQYSQTGRDFVGILKGSVHNIFGSSGGGSGFADSDKLNVNPQLGPLADNGGPTLTMALLPGSPAIDTGVNTFDAPEFDQRGPGFPRIVNGTIDIGAFEVQSALAPRGPDFAMFLVTADAKSGSRRGPTRLLT